MLGKYKREFINYDNQKDDSDDHAELWCGDNGSNEKLIEILDSE